jgi:hypothetical protein
MALLKKKKSFFGRLQEKIEDVIFMRPEIDEEMIEELEEVFKNEVFDPYRVEYFDAFLFVF